MGGHKHTVRERGRQSKHCGHDTRAPHGMPPCRHSLTWWGREGRYSVNWFYLYQSHRTNRDSIFTSGSISDAEVWSFIPGMAKISSTDSPTGCGSRWVTGKMTEWANSPFLKHDRLACYVSRDMFQRLLACVFLYQSISVLLRSTILVASPHHLQ